MYTGSWYCAFSGKSSFFLKNIKLTRKHSRADFRESTTESSVYCFVLQHTATHCNTLQHTQFFFFKMTRQCTSGAPTCCSPCSTLCCSTLQHTGTYCNTQTFFFEWIGAVNLGRLHLAPYAPRCVAAHCNTLQHTATHCNTLQHTATHTFFFKISRQCISSAPTLACSSVCYNTATRTATHTNLI